MSETEVTRPVFRFTTSSQKPTRRVLCLTCGWEARGEGRAVFPKADKHVCPKDGESDAR